jgi:signal transduction histidine kinase
MVNLLSNALKLQVLRNTSDVDEIAVSNKKKTTLKFSKDTGLGIKVENKEKIFKSFVQEDNSTNRKFEGLLGLAISNQLALMDSKLQPLVCMETIFSLKLNLKSSKLEIIKLLKTL